MPGRLFGQIWYMHVAGLCITKHKCHHIPFLASWASAGWIPAIPWTQSLFHLQIFKSAGCRLTGNSQWLIREKTKLVKRFVAWFSLLLVLGAIIDVEELQHHRKPVSLIFITCNDTCFAWTGCLKVRLHEARCNSLPMCIQSESNWMHIVFTWHNR